MIPAAIALNAALLRQSCAKTDHKRCDDTADGERKTEREDTEKHDEDLRDADEFFLARVRIDGTRVDVVREERCRA